jgi:antitoxin ParD1/3/4
MAAMNVSLTKELERVVDKKVKSGLYNNASEVVRDALRRAFCTHPEIDLEENTPELAALVREGMNSRHPTHKHGDIQKILAKVRSRVKE